MADNDNDIGAFLSGFVIGGLIGAAVALVLAPQSGEETRALIRERGIELKERAEETAAEARARAEQATLEARKRAEEMASQAKTKAEEVQQRGRVILEEQRERLGDAIEAGKQAARRKRGQLEGESPAGTGE